MFNDNIRTGIILVSLAVVACAACIAPYLTKRRKPRWAAEVVDPRKIAINVAVLKMQLGEAERKLAGNKKQLAMVRFSDNAESATAADFASTIARLEESVRRISAELKDQPPP